MVECPACGRKHRPGTLFCADCGVYLPTGGQLGTEPIEPRELPIVQGRGWDAGRGQRERRARQTVLRIKVLPTDREVALSCAGGVHVGRADAAQLVFPDVDLTPDGGLEGGVSRCHCKIYESEGECFVEDLGSANGTF
ncbi:MAG: FHA domain-containing protein, partial [Chloroflexota bacterium]